MNIIVKNFSKPDFSQLQSSRLILALFEQGLFSVSNFIFGVIIAKYFLPSEYSSYILAMSAGLFVLGFQRAISSFPYTILYNKTDLLFKKTLFLRNITFFSLPFLILSLLISVLLLLWSVLPLYMSSFMLLNYVRDLRISERKYEKALVVTMFFLLTVLTMFLLIECKNISIDNVFLYSSLIFLTLLVSSGNFSFFKRVVLQSDYKRTLLDFKEQMWFLSKPIIGSNVLFGFINQAMPWLILWYLSKEEVARFGVAFGAISLVNPVFKGLGAYLLGTFSSRLKDYGVKECLQDVKLWLFLSFMIIVLILIGFLYSKEVIVLIYGVKYNDMGLMLTRIPYLISCLILITIPFEAIINAAELPRLIFNSAVVRCIVMLILFPLLLPSMGFLGVFVIKLIDAFLLVFLLVGHTVNLE